MRRTCSDFMSGQLCCSSTLPAPAPGAMALVSRHLFCHLGHSRAVLSPAKVLRSRWTLPRAGSTQQSVGVRKPLVLKASEFQHLFEEGPTEKIYAGTTVGDLSQAQQGRFLQEWAKKVLQEKNPGVAIGDPKPGKRCNGSQRAGHQAEYDFIMDGRRVEIKSARLVWVSTERRWMARFQAIKISDASDAERPEPAFDDLFLVIMSPRGLLLIRHDHTTGVTTCGKATPVTGHRIQIYGRRGSHHWEEALERILRNLCELGSCSVIDEKAFSHPGVKDILLSGEAPAQKRLFADFPMGRMSNEKRGKRIQDIGLAIDRRLNPRSLFSAMNGNRGKANAPADWVRDAVPVELKSCRLTFDRTHNRWRCQFVGIKPDLFDELWLAVYSPTGIHYYRLECSNSLGFCKAGAVTTICGHQMYFFGPRGELDPLEAFEIIQAKMRSRGCELVAIVEWEKGASMQDASPTGNSC